MVLYIYINPKPLTLKQSGCMSLNVTFDLYLAACFKPFRLLYRQCVDISPEHDDGPPAAYSRDYARSSQTRSDLNMRINIAFIFDCPAGWSHRLQPMH